MNRPLLKTALAAVLAMIAGLATAAEPVPAPKSADAPTTASTAAAFDFPKAGDTRVARLDEVSRMLSSHGSDLLVVNFWATWCGPCVEELPYFVKLAQSHPAERVQVVGLSVDLRRDVQTKVIPFLKKREIPYPVLVVFGDQQTMISQFSADWGGEVPATFFYDRQGKKLGEVLGPLTEEELNAEVKKYLPAAAAKP